MNLSKKDKKSNTNPLSTFLCYKHYLCSTKTWCPNCKPLALGPLQYAGRVLNFDHVFRS